MDVFAHITYWLFSSSEKGVILWYKEITPRVLIARCKMNPTHSWVSYSMMYRNDSVTIGFDLCHHLDLEFSRSNMEFAISHPKVVRLPQNEKQTYRFNSRPQMWPMGLTLNLCSLTFEFWRSYVTLTFDHTHDLEHGSSWSNFEIAVFQNGEGRLTLHKGGGRRSFMTMTIWWPRSRVWIYQIVTGVPSTHLVYFIIEQIIFKTNKNLPLKAAWSCNFAILTASTFVVHTMTPLAM